MAITGGGGIGSITTVYGVIWNDRVWHEAADLECSLFRRYWMVGKQTSRGHRQSDAIDPKRHLRLRIAAAQMSF